MRNSFHETDADVTLSFETELDDKIPGHRVTESSDKLSSECQNGEKSKTLVDQSEIIINKTTVASSQNDQRSTEVVENHPLVMHELDDKSSSSGDHQGEVRQEKKAKVNPFLCDNADNQPFTSAEVSLFFWVWSSSNICPVWPFLWAYRCQKIYKGA